MGFKPRDYQEEVLPSIRKLVREGHRSILLVGACGIGKGTIIAMIIAAINRVGKRSMTTAHRIDLVAGPNALVDRLEKQLGIDRQNCGYVLSSQALNKYKISKKWGSRRPILFSTVQTASNRSLPKLDVLIIDEAHRAVTESYRKLINQVRSANPNVLLLGFTATPDRADKKQLGEIFTAMQVVLLHGEAVRRGYLVPYNYKLPITVDLSGVAIRSGFYGNDYSDEDLEKVYDDKVLNSIVDKWEQYASDKKTIVFTINRKAQAHALADLFRYRGYTAESIVSDSDERVKLLDDFAKNKYQVLTNVNLFTEGISIDDVECIILAFATKSITKYIQAASRGARPLWGPDGNWLRDRFGNHVKSECILIDCGGNVDRHHKVEYYGLTGFDIRPRPKTKRQQEAPSKSCPNCGAGGIPAPLMICPECGYKFPTKEDDKILATDAEWGEGSHALDYVKRFEKFPYDRLIIGLRNNYSPELLMPIAAMKGYKKSWVVKTAFDLKYLPRSPRLNANNPTDRDYLVRWLLRKTNKKGLRPAYNYYMQKQFDEKIANLHRQRN